MKLDNTLLTDDDPPRIKITDFGMLLYCPFYLAAQRYLLGQQTIWKSCRQVHQPSGLSLQTGFAKRWGPHELPRMGSHLG